MEGDIVGCPHQGGRKNPEQPLFYVNTSDILFIASGAFVGLDDIVARRLGAGKNRIGFSGPGNAAGTGAKYKGELLSLVLCTSATLGNSDSYRSSSAACL